MAYLRMKKKMMSMMMPNFMNMNFGGMNNMMQAPNFNPMMNMGNMGNMNMGFNPMMNMGNMSMGFNPMMAQGNLS